MDNGLIIGYDLCRDYCRISWFNEETNEPEDLRFSDDKDSFLIQNSICKKKGSQEWLIGEEAYQTALFGSGTIVDEILRLVDMGGQATFEGVVYKAEDLLLLFIKETQNRLFKITGIKKVLRIVFTVQTLKGNVLDALTRCLRNLGIDKQKIHIISHTEAYMYFILNQKKELWSNLTVLFDLSQEGLNYYEMDVMRGVLPNIAKAERTFLEEGFSPDILSSSRGQRMADNIMQNCVERLLDRKPVSAAYLSGLGMESCETWGTNFLKSLCRRRRVFYIDNLFARGACFSAFAREKGPFPYPYSLICEGRIDVDISVEVSQGVSQRTMHLATAGENWYETRASFDFIPDNETSLKLNVRKLGESRDILLEVPFTGFEMPGNKLKKIGAYLNFTSENSFDITLRDKGFGEICPSSETVIKRTFVIE